MKVLHLFCAFLLLPTFVKAEHVLHVGLIEGGRAPYFFAENSTKTGLYKDILYSIARSTGLKFTFDYYPQARLRKMMLSGRLDIEVGTDPLWRQAPEEIKHSSYSAPFMSSKESWVVAAHNENRIGDLISTPDLARPCLVLGFDIEDNMKNAQSNVKGNSDEHLLEMLLRKRCDIALIPNAILDYYQTFEDSRFITHSADVEHKLSIRIRKNKEMHLSKINTALNEMRNNGELHRLMKKYGINNS